MAERRPYDLRALETLACDIGARPAGAPHFGDVASAVRAVRREGNTLVVDYDPAVAETLAAVVEAERRCCDGIAWHLLGPETGAAGPALQLRIEAAPAQLDVLAPAIAPGENATAANPA